ncbi:MAG: zinc ribbon domain-containing protein [Vicinamibacterales bacterium]
MSSATSTDSLQPWQLFTLAGLIGATVVVFVSRGQTPAGIILLSLTIFAAAVVGLAAWRTFAPLSIDEDGSGPQILGGRTRAAVEREKTLVLRSIKELEFDRAMGKVSEKDFADMSARLRARAAGLIRQLDAGAVYREEIEKEIARRVKPSHSESSRMASKQATARAASGICAACATANDADARFCKHCGASLGKTA